MAIGYGMTKKEFFHSTPRDIEIFLDKHNENAKRDAEVAFERMKYTSWLTGLYVQFAVGSCLSKKGRYPKKPFGEDDLKDTVIQAREDMTKEEIEHETESFFGNLMLLQKQAEGVDGL